MQDDFPYRNKNSGAFKHLKVIECFETYSNIKYTGFALSGQKYIIFKVKYHISA